MEEELDQILIDYIQNRLPEAEREALAIRIQQEPEVKAAFQEAWLTQMAIQEAGDADLKQRLLQTERVDPKTSLRKPQWRWIGAVAAVIVLLVSFLLIRPGESRPDWDTYAEAFPLPTAPSGARSNTNTSSESWQKATDSYQRLQFDAAAQAFESYLQDTADIEAQFYVGMCYLQTGQAAKARVQLASIPEGHSLYQRASWYQAQSCVIEQDAACLKTQLQNIATQADHYRKQTAIEWLEQLK